MTARARAKRAHTITCARALVEQPGTAVSRQQLLDRIWGDAFLAVSHALYVRVNVLRTKLNPPGSDYDCPQLRLPVESWYRRDEFGRCCRVDGYGCPCGLHSLTRKSRPSPFPDLGPTLCAR
jgi:hypothetical protein